MSIAGRLVGIAAGALGVAAVGATAGVVRRHHSIEQREDEHPPFGSLHTDPVPVTTDDGVALWVELEEASGDDAPDLTVVFVHGYALTMDSWHFQRAAYRGQVRAVFYDQRSHGRSARSSRENATIDQLGRDLHTVIDATAPEGPVVVVGHSMGGMTVVALAEQHPELFGERIVGVGLVSTTAGGLDPSRLLLPFLPARLGGVVTVRAVAALARGHQVIDGVRRLGRGVAEVATDVFAFGGPVPRSYVEFADSMLSATPFEVVAEFFPSFKSLDKFDAVEVMGRVPTTIVCGTSDLLTSIGHSRKLHERIAGSVLVECEGAGHLVQLERHAQVGAALDQLLAASVERSRSR